MDEPLIPILLPDRRLPAQGDFDCRPERVRAWLETLPLADPGESSRRLLRLLTETNRLELPWETRLRLLAALAEPMEGSSRLLQERLAEAELPLPERPLRVAQLCRDLHREAAMGYLIVVQTLECGPAGRRKSMAVATLGALRHLGCALLTGFQARLPPAPGLWQLLHGTMAAALRNDIEHYTPRGGPLELRDLYKRAVLFAAADPHRLRPREAAELYRLLGRQAGAVPLRPCDRASPPPALTFAIDLAGDSGPVPAECCGALTRSLLLLDVAPLCTVWEAQGDQLTPALGATLRHWRSLATARPARRPGSGSVRVLPGLARIHARLQDELGEADPEIDGQWAPARFTALPRGTLQRRANDPFVRAMGELGLERHGTGDRMDTEPEPWLIRDIAPNGLRIAHTLTPRPRWGMHSGELVGLYCEGATEMRLGLVRWVRTEGEMLEAGVTVLCGTSAAVSVRREGSNYQRALLLETERGKELLVPARTLTAGALHLRRSGAECSARINGPREETASCGRFELQCARHPSPAEEKARDDFADRFGLLWTGL